MRPLELDLTAFRSYDRATVDLRPHELVVISGDTGAGKTSLLDAVCFALFGRTPEQKGKRHDLLTLGHRHGEVRLTFSARDDVWRVTRRYGKDAPEPAQVLERLDAEAGAPVEVIGGERAVGARLARVVGMSYEAFTSAVLLAQGRFAQFLGSQPRDRDEILRELFGVAPLEGARQAALANASGAERVADLRDGDAARLPAHGLRERAAAARGARDAAARHAAARGLRPLAARLAGHEAAAADARRRAERAREAAAELPDEEAGAALVERLAAARRDAVDAERDRARAARRRARSLTGRDAARARHGGGAAELAALRERAERAERLQAELPARRAQVAEREEALARRRAQVEELRRTLAGAVAERDRLLGRVAASSAWRDRRREHDEAAAALAGAEAEAARAGARREAAERALAEAEEAHARAHRHDLAARLRAELPPGEPCPVCGGAVGEDAPDPGGDVAALEAARAAARAAAGQASRHEAAAQERARAAAAVAAAAAERRERAGAALREAGIAEGDGGDSGEAERAQAQQAAIAAAEAGVAGEERAIASEEAGIAAAERQVARDADEVAEARAGLGEWGAREAPSAAIAAALEEVRAAEEAADAAAELAEREARRAAAAQGEVAALERGPVAALRATAARVAARGRLEAPGDDLPADELVAAALRLRAAARDAAASHGRRAGVAEEEAAAVRVELAGRGAALGASEPEQVEAALRRCERDRDAARGRLGELAAAAAEARRLRALAAVARAEAQVHRQVATDLRANNFPRFLLARYRERLAVGASERLQELTAGAYRFAGTEPDPMAVVDTRRGDRLRPAATLSGGERFLASLALALGLSDVAAESSGRLDCLFLDEGFSTLDADSLEQALCGIERLAHDGRLVAVITHLPGVAERLGAAIRIEKDPAGVSRVAA